MQIEKSHQSFSKGFDPSYYDDTKTGLALTLDVCKHSLQNQTKLRQWPRLQLRLRGTDLS